VFRQKSSARSWAISEANDGVDIGAVVQRWDENPDLVEFGVGYLLYGLLDLRCLDAGAADRRSALQLRQPGCRPKPAQE
jgi:hypothetical protein